MTANRFTFKVIINTAMIAEAISGLCNNFNMSKTWKYFETNIKVSANSTASLIKVATAAPM